ncbi:tyrosine-type recombinase/integrase [Flavobacterium oreochromis]|uniref:tyrosine-type recombinase/integrase n=1 Tax=Flavobacterium oreochromis TaxID=2906078 RepID=UPI00385AF229
MVNQLNLLGYSQSTIRCYVQELAQFLYFIKDKKASECKLEDITEFLLHCLSALKLKENTIHSRINGIKFYYEEILKQPKIALEIPRPKKQLKLPKALHSTEIKAIFNVTENLKHNTILKLCYGMGLRVSEIVQLRIYDIDSKNMRVHVQKGKGKKDRYVNLPESILSQLRKYYHEYKPKEYLFEGQYGGQYSIRSIQKIFKEALCKAGIRKPIGIHSLRHSYATHLLENGTDIRFIQELLGHNDIKMTLIYTKLTDMSLRKIISPLDNL